MTNPMIHDTPHDLTAEERHAWSDCWRTALEASLAHPSVIPNGLRGLPLFPTSCADMMILDLRARGAANPVTESTLKLKQRVNDLRVDLAAVRQDYDDARAKLEALQEATAEFHVRAESVVADNKRLNAEIRNLRVQIARMEVHTLYEDEDEYARIRWSNDRGAKLIAAHRWGDEMAEDLFPGVPTSNEELEDAWKRDLALTVHEQYLKRSDGDVADAREAAAFTHGSEIALRAFPIGEAEDSAAVTARLADVTKLGEVV